MTERVSKVSVRGFTLLEILITVAIIGLIVTLAMPSISRSRTTTQRRICIKNLQAIDAAKQQWALENRKIDGARVTAANIRPYLTGQRMPLCPANGNYAIQILGRDPTCTRRALGHSITNAF